MNSKLVCIEIFLLCIGIEFAVSFDKDYFMAAVYVHPRWGVGTSASPSSILRHNLLLYRNAAKEAKLRGADIIVFPEYGLFPTGDREELKPYLETVPDPKITKINPCREPLYFIGSPILQILSCFALSNEIVIVANMGAYEDCAGEAECHLDGRRNHNTNVVFDKDGTLLKRYYKKHLFSENGMDVPIDPQDPLFDTEFGKFATFTCFDSMFETMAQTGRFGDIDAVVFPSEWKNSFPFYTSTQWWQSWAIGNNATVLASNMQIPGLLAAGSGIYTGRSGALVSSLSADGIPKLLIARVPKRNKVTSQNSTIIAFTENGAEEWRSGDGVFLPTCGYKRLDKPKDVYRDYRCLEPNLENYTLVRLQDTIGSISVCNRGMCCYLEYAAVSMEEEFYLGVYNGTYVSFAEYEWEEENCFVARCDELEGVPCSAFTTVSNTVFKYLYLSASFSTQYVYPSVVGSQYKLMPYSDWKFIHDREISSVEFNTNDGFPLLMATLKGRPYDRDPSHIHERSFIMEIDRRPMEYIFTHIINQTLPSVV